MKYLKSFLERNDMYKSDLINDIYGDIKNQIEKKYNLIVKNNAPYTDQFYVYISLLELDLIMSFEKTDEIGLGKTKSGIYFMKIDKIGNNFYENYIEYEDIIKHEIVHLLDDINSKGKIPNTAILTNKSQYYNHYVEINAYLLQGINNFLSKYDSNKEHYKQYLISFEKFYNYIIEECIKSSLFMFYLNKKTDKNVRKRLYDLYSRLKNNI